MKRKFIYLRKSLQKGKFFQSAGQVQQSEFENVLVFAEIGSDHALGCFRILETQTSNI